MSKSLDNYKAPFTAKEFGKWVDSEWDIEMLELIESMIGSRINELKLLVDTANRVEIDSISIPTYIDETPLDLLDNQTTIQILFKEAGLSDRQIEILQMFYGLGCEELTIYQISEKIGLGVCRVNQIKQKSIRMLRKNKNNIQL